MFQCYFEYPVDEDGNRRRCRSQQEDCWCSPEHKQAWQDEHYGRPKNKILSIAEIKSRLLEMGEK